MPFRTFHAMTLFPALASSFNRLNARRYRDENWTTRFCLERSSSFGAMSDVKVCTKSSTVHI